MNLLRKPIWIGLTSLTLFYLSSLIPAEILTTGILGVLFPLIQLLLGATGFWFLVIGIIQLITKRK